MSEAKHTKGPWQQDGSHIYGPDPERLIVCQMHYIGRGYQEESAANESLIKAAPDLLEALKELLGISSMIEVLGEWEAMDVNRQTRAKNRAIVDGVISKCRSVISKAAGRV